MATDDVLIRIRNQVVGKGDVKALNNELGELGTGARRAVPDLKSLAIGVTAVGAALTGAAVVARKAYEALRAGAQLQTTAQQFDKLSQSIGTTADTMLGKLRTATQGMISDADLMANAAQIMSLKLADNQDQVVRLATVAGRLGWDMQQVILTFANMSTMRLDALGLSVEDVTSKAKELEAAGMSAQQAFKEAVILAGEARMDVAGLSEAEQAFKKWEAAIANTRNELMLTTVELAKQIGLIESLDTAASKLGLLRQIKELDEQMYAAGLSFDSFAERAIRSDQLVHMSVQELQAEVLRLQHAVEVNQDSWMRWGGGVQNAADAAAAAVARVTAEVADADAVLMQTVRNWQSGLVWDSPYQRAMAERNAKKPKPLVQSGGYTLYDSGETNIRAIEKQTAAIRSYSGAVRQATSAEMALADARARLVSYFDAAIGMTEENALITAEGTVNVANMNKELYAQARAAGASAGTLALLGVATGQFTREQAAAALNAAILQEKIAQIAKQVASGNIKIEDAVGSLDAFRQQLESGDGAAGQATGSVEGLSSAVDDLITSGPYSTEIIVENQAALQAIQEVQTALNNLPDNVSVGGSTTTTTGGNAPIAEPTTYSVPASDLTTYQGSSSIVVNNYVDGQQVGRARIADITYDSLLAAMKSLGL